MKNFCARYLKKKLILCLLFIATILIPFSAYAFPDKDFIIFGSCFGQAPIGICIKADFNQDGRINFRDYSLLNEIFMFDLNMDRVVDLTSNTNGTDLAILQSCIGQAISGLCGKADFNSDGVIDATDEVLLWQAVTKFDFDGDLRAEYYVDIKPFFRNITDKTTSEGQVLSFYIWAQDGDGEAVSYSFGAFPNKVEYFNIIIGDLNDDGVVNNEDTSILNAAVINNTTVNNKDNALFDLDNNGLINTNDLQSLETLVGKSENAFFFTWEPGDKQSGFYDISFNATSTNIDGINVTTSRNIKITVVDIQSIEDYYAYDDVLVVINQNSPVSQAIGNYFTEQRSISKKHIVYINSSTQETINWNVYSNSIAAPIKQHLLTNNLETKINYIVTTKGVPLRIYQQNFNFGSVSDTLRRSVDSQLTLLSSSLAISRYSSRNPYFNSIYPFSSEMYGIYLVTRLTGYTEADVMQLIDNAAMTTTNGTFIFDVDPTRGISGNDWMRQSNETLSANGWDTFIDETTTYLTGQTNVLGYVSWGSNDANDTNNAIPNNNWVPGAIAETYVSSSARTFTAPARYGQSLIADWIAEGVTGIKGYTFEPYLASMARPNILFPRYTDGFILADSFFAASHSVGWQGVVVGDPKASIISSISVLWKKSDARQLATDWVTNSSPTYVLDGFDLLIIKTQDIRQCPFCYSVTLSFTSRNAGYGKRIIVSPAITPHVIEVVVKQGKIISVINDGIFDELNSMFISL